MMKEVVNKKNLASWPANKADEVMQDLREYMVQQLQRGSSDLANPMAASSDIRCASKMWLSIFQ